jgi:hypothetical protein
LGFNISGGKVVHRLRIAPVALFVVAALFVASSLRAQIVGFGGSTMIGWTVNNAGGPAASVTGTGGINDVLNITSAVNSDDNSYFFNTPQPITTGGWTASFTYVIPAGSTPPADGITFTLQNDPRGAAALGGGGGSLGYSGGFAQPPVNGANGIIRSEAVHFNIYTGAANGVGSNLFVNAGGAASGGTYVSTSPVALNSINTAVNVVLTYNGAGTISESLTQGANTFNTTFAAPAYQTVLGGGNTFVVGFTGATGGLNAAQQISQFSFTPVGSQVAPSLNIFKVGDPIAGINAVAGAGTVANSPAAEQAPNSLDSSQPTKYLNFNKVGAGILVTPSIGSTVANHLALTSANDSPERDPATYEVWGTNDTNQNDISPALNPTNWQNFWTLISSGAVPSFAYRGAEQEIDFANSTQYSSYLVDFPTVANAAAANSMQVADIQLSGSVPEPAGLAMLGFGAAGLLAIRRRRKAGRA